LFNGIGKLCLQFSAKAAKQWIFLRTPRNVRDLLFPGVLVVFNMQSADFQPLQIA
jgi:hypothetical protein